MSDFDEVELLFEEFLAVAKATLTDSERAAVADFVDVGEYGLALRTAIAIYIEERKAPTIQQHQLISRLAQKLGAQGRKLIDRLPNPIL